MKDSRVIARTSHQFTHHFILLSFSLAFSRSFSISIHPFSVLHWLLLVCSVLYIVFFDFAVRWCDAYVKVFVSKEEFNAGRYIKKTEVIEKNKDPVWNDQFELYASLFVHYLLIYCSFASQSD